MKITMILLFIALTTAAAQTDWKRVVEMPSPDAKIDTISIDQAFFVQPLLRLYSRYEKECRRDTLGAPQIWDGNEWRNTQEMWMPLWKERGYLTRRTLEPTFSGFIDYLRGKK